MSIHIHTAEELQNLYPKMSDRNAKRLEEIARERLDLFNKLDKMSEWEWYGQADAIHTRIDKLDSEEEQRLANIDTY